MMIGKILSNLTQKKFFRLMIDFGHKVDDAFVAYLMFCFISSLQDGTGLAREILYIG
jgi:hypothetical protein